MVVAASFACAPSLLFLAAARFALAVRLRRARSAVSACCASSVAPRSAVLTEPASAESPSLRLNGSSSDNAKEAKDGGVVLPLSLSLSDALSLLRSDPS